ncbi:MAG: acyl-CoA thioesterase [Candidatus Omnitrophica bacterium]|nr:acyl-CoA thioesterase [Candidatus Omnitrophota bacterium]
MGVLEDDLEVYTFDIDFAGHVNNGVYIRWLEIGRTKLLEAVGLPVEKIKETGFYPILAHTEISYKRALFMGERVRVELWVSELTRARVILQFRFLNREGALVAHSRQIGAFIDLETGRPKRLAEDHKKLFMAYYEPEKDLLNG